MTVPDCLGYYLGEARIILENAGINIDSIKVTSPPRSANNTFDDTYRIIRQSSAKQNTIELLICKPL
jgi:hypothetical protein